MSYILNYFYIKLNAQNQWLSKHTTKSFVETFVFIKESKSSPSLPYSRNFNNAITEW